MGRFNWREQVWVATQIFIQFGSLIFGLSWSTKLHILFDIYNCCWIGDIFFFICHTLLYEIPSETFSLGGLMNLLLYLAQMLAHLMVLIESLAKQKDCTRLWDKLGRVETRLLVDVQHRLDETRCRSDGRLCIVVAIGAVLMTFVHTILSWTVYPSSVIVTTLYWHSLPSVLALQFKVLRLICVVATLNEYLAVLHLNIDDMGESNLRRVFRPQQLHRRQQWHPDSLPLLVAPRQSEPDEERMLGILKCTYSDVYALFQDLNDCFGWSMLAFIIMYFIYFVANSYWTVLALITQGQNEAMLVKNVGFLIVVVVLLWILCWQCQKSTDQSRQIGCVIYKLVKPLGAKSYNDMVTDFSLQTLHQRFVLTARNFFDLNLNLLGSMVAAIVTYLVILIQFMLAEEDVAESSFDPHKSTNSTLSVRTESTTSLPVTTMQDFFTHYLADYEYMGRMQ